MADYPNEKGPPDSRRVNIYEDHELNYWIKELNVSQEELRMAVMEVGTSAEAVKKYLKKEIHSGIHSSPLSKFHILTKSL
jgi:hypothetical protein